MTAPWSKNPEQVKALTSGWNDPYLTFEELCESINKHAPPYRTPETIKWKARTSNLGDRFSRPAVNVRDTTPVVTYANHKPVTREEEVIKASKEAQEKLMREAAESKKKEADSKKNEKVVVDFLNYDQKTKDLIAFGKSQGYTYKFTKIEGKPDKVEFFEPEPLEAPRSIIIPRKETDKGVTELERAMNPAITSFMKDYLDGQQTTVILLRKNNELLMKILEERKEQTKAARSIDSKLTK